MSKYREGSVFAVPLRTSGWVLGVIARVPSDKSGTLLGYFYDRKFDSMPNAAEATNLRAEHAVRILRFGDLSLLKGKWPVLAQISGWNRKSWPMPQFVRRDDISKKAWEVSYSEDDITHIVSERPLSFDSNLEPASMFGAGAVELLLTKLADKGSTN